MRLNPFAALGFLVLASWTASPVGAVEFPAEVVLESLETGVAVRALGEVPVPRMDRSMRFSGRVVIEGGTRGAARLTPQRDINFDGELACVIIRQLDAEGRELVSDASLGVAKRGRHELVIEAAPVPGAVRAVLECRVSGIQGRAFFSEFRWEPEVARLFSSAGAKRVVEPGRSPGIEINGRVLPPLMVHGQNLETSDDVSASVADLALPYQHGLRLFSFNAWFPGVTSQNTVANLDHLVGAYPEAYFLLRVWLGPRAVFFKDYPDERLAMSDGVHLTDMATPTSAVWRRHAEASIRRFVLELRKSPAAERLAGIIPMYYVTGEWQLGDPGSPYLPKSQEWRMQGFSERHRAAFADWAIERHGSLEALNAAWNSEYPDPASIKVPTDGERKQGEWGSLRDPALQQRVIDHGRFLSVAVSDAILWCSETFREAFHNRILTGPFYGHVLEHAWSATGVQQQGHLGIGRLLDAPAIDFHGSPYSYANDSRFPGLPLSTNAILDSAPLHGKAAFLEEDTFTHVARPPEGFIAPGAHQKTKSLEETLAVLHRNLGASLARGYVHYWMGLLEDGRFNLPEIWDSYQPVFEWLVENPLRPAYRPHVALVIDEEAIPYLAEDGRGVVGRWLFELRNILGRVDTTLGVYLQSDLDRIPDSVRCLILATPYHVREEDRRVLQQRWMRDGRVIVFCQFPDVVDGATRRSPPGSITGIELNMLDITAQPTSRITGEGLFAPWRGAVIGEPVDRAVIFWRANATLPPIHPLVVVTDPLATALARYENVPGNPVSVAIREMGDWTSVVTGVHSLPPGLWREMIRLAGAHLYLENMHEDFDRPDVIEATSDFLMVISGRDGERTINLPEPGRLIPLDARPASPELSTSHSLELRAGAPRLFRIEKGVIP